MYNNEERQGLDGSQSKSNRYIHFLFVAPQSLPQKGSNSLTDLGKTRKNLNHLICILKLGSSDNC